MGNFSTFFSFINSSLGITICHIGFLDIALFPHTLNHLGYQSSAGKRALISLFLNREGAKEEKWYLSLFHEHKGNFTILETNKADFSNRVV